MPPLCHFYLRVVVATAPNHFIERMIRAPDKLDGTSLTETLASADNENRQIPIYRSGILCMRVHTRVQYPS